MTHLWIGSSPITVTADPDGLPRSFLWRGGKQRVELISGHWRVDMEWWRWRIWRDYFHLITYEGLMVTVYHDLITDQWYLGRLYD